MPGTPAQPLQQSPPPTGNAGLIAPMRILFGAAGVLVTGVGLPLFLAPAYTDVYFPFPIDPPETAAFLGASYLAAAVLQFSAARAPTWQQARVAAPGVLVFTVITLGLTLRNLWRGHISAATAPGAIWLATYATFPALMAWAWRRQSQVNPAALAPVPPDCPLPRAARHALGVAAVAVLVFGVALLVVPRHAGAFWAWDLSPPNTYAGRAGMEPYVGAWLIGIGITGVLVWLDPDAARSRPALLAGATLLTLQAVVFARSVAGM